jgi:hypothetical protein
MQIITNNLHIKALRIDELGLHANMVITSQANFDSLLRGAATRLLVDRLSSNLHCWGPCVVHGRLACHPDG